jgi:hypothetical protein
MRVGIFDHFGWAIAVTTSDDHELVDRLRIALVEPGVCEAPIHYESKRLTEAETAALVAEVRASIRRAAAAAFGALAESQPAPITSISLREWPPDFPVDIATQRRVPYESRADAIMYRQVLAEAAEARGWRVHLYNAKDVLGQAVALLGNRATEVLEGQRTRLGPPWTKDHQLALAAAITSE